MVLTEIWSYSPPGFETKNIPNSGMSNQDRSAKMVS